MESFFFSKMEEILSQINHFLKGRSKNRIPAWHICYVVKIHICVYLWEDYNVVCCQSLPYSAWVILAEWNYDLAKPVLAECSFCLSIEHSDTARLQSLDGGHSQSGPRGLLPRGDQDQLRWAGSTRSLLRTYPNNLPDCNWVYFCF